MSTLDERAYLGDLSLNIDYYYTDLLNTLRNYFQYSGSITELDASKIDWQDQISPPFSLFSDEVEPLILSVDNEVGDNHSEHAADTFDEVDAERTFLIVKINIAKSHIDDSYKGISAIADYLQHTPDLNRKISSDYLAEKKQFFFKMNNVLELYICDLIEKNVELLQYKKTEEINYNRTEPKWVTALIKEGYMIYSVNKPGKFIWLKDVYVINHVYEVLKPTSKRIDFYKMLVDMSENPINIGSAKNWHSKFELTDIKKSKLKSYL